MKSLFEISNFIILFSVLMVFSCSKKKDINELPKTPVIEKNNVYAEKSNVEHTDSIEKLPLTGSFFIDDNSRFQSIYSSQNYGTYYELYARCNFDKNKNLKSVDLKLMNYKGLLNIGFTNISSLKFNDTILRLNLFVKGMTNNHPIRIPFSQKVNMNEIKMFNVYRTLVPLDSTSTVFDDEFNYRSGIDTDLRKPRRGLSNFPKEKDQLIEALLGRSGRCYTSTNYVKTSR